MTKHRDVGMDTPGKDEGKWRSSDKRGFAALRQAAVAHDLDDDFDEQDTAARDTGARLGSLSHSEIGNKIVAAALRRATTAADRRRP